MIRFAFNLKNLNSLPIWGPSAKYPPVKLNIESWLRLNRLSGNLLSLNYKRLLDNTPYTDVYFTEPPLIMKSIWPSATIFIEHFFNKKPFR